MIIQCRAPVRVDRRRLLERAGALATGVIAAPFIGRMDRAMAAWPADRPVRIVVPNSPGGPSDITARFIAPALQEALGGRFVIENRPGGSGNIGTATLIRAEPDGYTFGVVTSGYAINASLRDPPPYDPFKDLVPVAELASSPSMFVVRPDLGVSTMQEMVALARKDQGKFNIGSPPIGSTLHLGAELLKFREGLDKVAIVIFPGGGQAVLGILGGNVELCSSSLAPVHALIKEGRLRGLAILGDRRWHDLPDVPTAEEAGYKDFNFETCIALMAPVNNPAPDPQERRKGDARRARQPGATAKNRELWIPRAGENRRGAYGAPGPRSADVPGHHQASRHQGDVAAANLRHAGEAVASISRASAMLEGSGLRTPA